jgi:Kinesin-like protein
MFGPDNFFGEVDSRDLKILVDRHRDETSVYGGRNRVISGTGLVVTGSSSSSGTSCISKTTETESSGKTFENKNEVKQQSSVLLGTAQARLVECLGVIPQTLLYLLTRVKTSSGLSLKVNYVEVFGSQVRDLLTGDVVQSFTTTPPKDHTLLDGEDVRSIITTGDQHKRAAATAMNLRSTRAHAVVIVKLFLASTSSSSPTSRRRSSFSSGPEEHMISKLILLDLGGSEKLARSRAHETVKAPGGFVSGDQHHAGIRII